MNINVVRRTNQRRFTEVCATRKQRVECLEINIVRIIVAAGDVRLQTESWFERGVLKRETDIGGGRPCLDLTVAKTAELIDKLKVVIPPCLLPPNSRADGVPDFVSRPLVEVRVVPIQAEVVKVNISSWQPGNWRHGVESPRLLIGVGIIIEHASFRSNRLYGEGVHPPVAEIQDGL